MTTTPQAIWAGSAVSENGEGQVVRHLASNTHENDQVDIAAESLAEQGNATCKIFSTLRARLALAGFILIQYSAGDGEATYRVTRWNLAVDLHSLADVAAFADRGAGAR
jgi:hypothetical protein